MSIDEILDDMDELLDKASGIPFASHKSLIDGERLRELISDIRLNMPQEIKHAKMVAYDRDRIIKEAEAKAEQIVRQAEERAKVLVSKEVIVREAKNRAVEAVKKTKAECDSMLAAAKAEVARTRSDCEAIKQATDGYISSRFREAEEYYANSLKDVQERKAKIDKLRKRRNDQPTSESASAPAQETDNQES